MRRSRCRIFDLDVVGDRIGTGASKLRSMAAILLPRELGVELHDAPGNRLQLQDLRGRGSPGVKRHALEIVQYVAGVYRVGLRPLHVRPGKIFIARGLTTITSTFLAWCKASANSRL